MKRVYILFLSLFVVLSVSAQQKEFKYGKLYKPQQNAEVPQNGIKASLFESFEAGVPPAGWTKQNPDGGTGWATIANGTSPLPGWTGGTLTVPPGGGSNAAYCTWNTGGGSSNDQWLVTPQMLIESGDMLTFYIIKMYAYLDVVEIKLSTTGNAPADFSVTLATYNYASTDDLGWELKSIDLSAYAGQNVYIAFRELVADNYNDGAFIALDLVQVGSLNAVDLNLAAITTPAVVSTGNLDITGSISNAGSNAITSFDVYYNIDGGANVGPYSVTGLNIATGGAYNFTHNVPYNFTTDGNYTINVLIDNVNGTTDEDVSNNTLSKDITVNSSFVQRRVLHEIFTANWCGPCAAANPVFDALITNNSADWQSGNHANATVLKYQCWGDAYDIADNDTRVAYYGDIEGIPAMKADGSTDYHPGSYSQTNFNTHLAVPSFYSIDAEHAISGNDISIDVTINPFASGNAVVRVGVFEKMTTGNVGSNGETEFHHVLMKMLPDAAGTAVTFTSGTEWTQTFNYDMSTTFVEEMTDLGVVIFIQDDATKTVAQSNYSVFLPEQIDGMMSAIVSPNNDGGCTLTDAEEVTVTITNFGVDPISGFGVSFVVDGGTPVTETYAGTLTAGQSGNYTFTATADLSAIGTHTIEAYVTVASDGNTGNDGAEVTVTNADAVMQVNINTDNYGGETTWEVYDIDLGAVVATGGPYASSSTFNEQVCITASHCYRFTIYDSYGDGMCCTYGEGSYEVIAFGVSQGTGGEFADSETIDNICATNIREDVVTGIVMYPNPTTGVINIENAENSTITIYNILGEVVSSINNAENLQMINLTNQPEGTYIVKIENNNSVVTQKFILSK
jgi:thiol-disulfide isomerase/thioredoxin